jgi:ribosome-binding ATPase YchF (GTP1/OBG family)
VVSAQIESDLVDLEPEDAKAFLADLGVKESGVGALIRATYHLLGLRTYFTTGEKESRAWTFYAGSSAPECAGRIHSDFQRGFIKAEVIHWDELLQIGSWTKAKELGKIRIEGKEYHPIDGDVMEFRFNV